MRLLFEKINRKWILQSELSSLNPTAFWVLNIFDIGFELIQAFKAPFLLKRNKYILHKITCLWQYGNKIWNQAAPVWLDFGCNVSTALRSILVKLISLSAWLGLEWSGWWWWKSALGISKFVDLHCLSLSLSCGAALGGLAVAPYRVSQPAGQWVVAAAPNIPIQSNKLRKLTREDWVRTSQGSSDNW